MTRAADLSSGAAGYKLAMDVKLGVAGKSVDMSGNGAFDPQSHEGSLLMNMSLAGQTLAIQVVIANDTIYEQLPSQIASQLPGGKSWISINLAQMGKLAKIPGMSSLMDSSSEMSNPGAYLDFLKAASGGSVQNLGQETLDGVQTTHYSAQIDPSKLVDAVPSGARQALSAVMGAANSKYHISYGPMDAWIDQAGLVRKIAMTISESVDGKPVSTSVTEQFSDYGKQPAPTVPSAADTTDLLSLVNSAG